MSFDTRNPASRSTSVNILTAGFLVLCAGVFLGNAFIATGQGLLILGVVVGFLRKDGDGWCWSRLRLSSWWLVAVTGFSLVSILANLDTISEPLQFVKKLRYHSIAIVLLSLSCIRDGKLFSGSKLNIYTVVWLASLV